MSLFLESEFEERKNSLKGERPLPLLQVTEVLRQLLSQASFNISNLDSNKGPLTFIIPENRGRVLERLVAFDAADKVGKTNGKFVFINSSSHT